MLRLGERVLELFDLALQTAGFEPLVPERILSRLSPPFEPVEFMHIISWLTTRNLHAEFDKSLNIKHEAVELWKLTGGKVGKADDGKVIELSGGRWRDVELLAVELDELLGSWDGKNPRIITRQILDQLKANLGQMKD